MLKLRKLVINLILVAPITIASICWSLPVAAVTQELQIVSSDGYRMEAAFDYHETESEAIAEQGKGATKAIDSMVVSFYEPDGEIIASYDNVVAGVAEGNYFKFSYDLKTQQVFGEIDLGGESAGEVYLKGNIGQGLHLVKVNAAGEEVTMDKGQWTVNNKTD